jgi:membrane protein DedA with SNARE-associated domain
MPPIDKYGEYVLAKNSVQNQELGKDIIILMLEWIQTIMDTLGYPGIAILMFLEVVFPPIPSEVIMPLGGFASNKGSLNMFGVVTAGTAGSMAGAVVFYYVGKIVGTERLVMLADKYGKWLTVSGEDVKKADHWFDRHGEKVVLLCRLVPGIRSLVSLPAGVAMMKMVPFLLYTLIGTVIWNIALTGAGYFLGKNYELVDQYMGDSGKIVLGVLAALAVILYTVRLVQQMRKEEQKRAAVSVNTQAAQPFSAPQQQTWQQQAPQPALSDMPTQQMRTQQASWHGTPSHSFIPPQQPQQPQSDVPQLPFPQPQFPFPPSQPGQTWQQQSWPPQEH